MNIYVIGENPVQKKLTIYMNYEDIIIDGIIAEIYYVQQGLKMFLSLYNFNNTNWNLEYEGYAYTYTL